MGARLIRGFLAVVLCVGFSAGARAADGRDPGQLLPEPAHSLAERGPRFARAIELLRERLKDRPEADRVRAERHLQELLDLPPQARERLLRRARALRERERAAAAPEAAPAPAEPPAPREEAHRKHLRESLRQSGAKLREHLPKELLERLEHARPEQRRRILERLWQERERFSRKALERWRQRYGLSRSEVRHFERLTPEERLQALIELEREHRARPRPEGKRG